MEISTSGYDVIRTANSRRSGAATIHPSNRLLNCLPAATTAASNSALRSRGIVAESKIAIGINSIIAVASLATRRRLFTPAQRGGDEGAECRRETLIQSPWAVLLHRHFALQSVEWPPIASSFPPLDPVREAGARPDDSRFTPACCAPPSVTARALRRKAAECTDAGASPRRGRSGQRFPSSIQCARVELERITAPQPARSSTHSMRCEAPFSRTVNTLFERSVIPCPYLSETVRFSRNSRSRFGGFWPGGGRVASRKYL
jgi:hypothetical protein